MSGSTYPIKLISSGARARGLDPRAVLAVAGQEGLGGGVGDNGHAFGPFQLNDAGGVLTGRPGSHQAFAESPAGINWALDRIAGVARGLHGGQAVNAIVRQFERPKDPGGEVARALASYGGPISSGGAAPTASSPAGAAAAGTALDPGLRREALLQLISSVGHPGGDLRPFLSALQAYRSSGTPAAGGLSTSLSSGAPADGRNPGLSPGHGGLAELLQEGTGGPTHSTGPHTHAAFTNPRLELAAITWAQQHGLHVGENPYVGDQVDPVHARNSYHYRTFPGLFNGRHLGQAIDVSGPNTNAFYQWLAQRRG